MSDDTSSEDKTEEPTEKKIRDAVEKGRTPHSREVSLFMSLGAFLITMSLVLRDNVRPLIDAMMQVFASPDRFPPSTTPPISSPLFP